MIAQLLEGGRLDLPKSVEDLPGASADNAAFGPCLPAYKQLVEACWAQVGLRTGARG